MSADEACAVEISSSNGASSDASEVLVKVQFRFKFWPTFFILAIVFTLFNLKAVRYFFFGIDPNERVTRTLEWKTAAGATRWAVFSIPRGYYAPADHNREGEAIVLDVMYPDKAFVPWGDTKGPNPSKVYILIQPGGEHTMGDAIKAAIDNNTLGQSRFSRKLVSKQDDFYVFESLIKDPRHRARSGESYLFHDAVRGHWMESQWSDSLMQVRENILKDQTALIYYRHRESIEPNPITMNHWVMEFVESLQVNSQPTKEKQPGKQQTSRTPISNLLEG